MENAILMSELIKIELPSLVLSANEKWEWKKRMDMHLANEKSDWLKYIYEFLSRWLDESDTIELKTSGSTGEPKIIRVRKETMLFSAQQTTDYFQFKNGEQWLLCLPAQFIAGQMMIIRAILNEIEFWATEPKINLQKLNGSFDFAAMIPMQVDEYLSSNLKIKNIIIGGAAISQQVEQKLKKTAGTQFYATYGMTETVSHIALRKINGNNHSEYFTSLKNILVGKDDRGCLTIYHKNYSQNVICTNDLVEFNTKNEFKIIGRLDNVINSGGLKIIPEEIEKVIAELIPNRILVGGFPDEKLGDKPVLLIEGNSWDNSTLLLFKKSLADKLEKNKSPKEIIFINQFSETENGKINRKLTKETYLKNRLNNL